MEEIKASTERYRDQKCHTCSKNFNWLEYHTPLKIPAKLTVFPLHILALKIPSPSRFSGELNTTGLLKNTDLAPIFILECIMFSCSGIGSGRGSHLKGKEKGGIIGAHTRMPSVLVCFCPFPFKTEATWNMLF